jgi:hypothetical protein
MQRSGVHQVIKPGAEFARDARLHGLAKSNLRALNGQAFLTSCLSDLNSCLTARSLGALELKFSASKRSISADLSRLPRRQAKAPIEVKGWPRYRPATQRHMSPSNSTSHIAQQLNVTKSLFDRPHGFNLIAQPIPSRGLV